MRIFGPAMSMSTEIRRPTASLAARTFSVIARQAMLPSCAQLMRAMSMPRCARSRTSAGLPAASLGSVTMMRVRRCAGCVPKSASVASASLTSPAKKIVLRRSGKRARLAGDRRERGKHRVERRQHAALKPPERGEPAPHQLSLQRAKVVMTKCQIVREIGDRGVLGLGAEAGDERRRGAGDRGAKRQHFFHQGVDRQRRGMRLRHVRQTLGRARGHASSSRSCALPARKERGFRRLPARPENASRRALRLNDTDQQGARTRAIGLAALPAPSFEEALRCSASTMSLRPVPPAASKGKDTRARDIRENNLLQAQLAAWVKQSSRLPGERM